jgi:hypothetical protein
LAAVAASRESSTASPRSVAAAGITVAPAAEVDEPAGAAFGSTVGV